MKRTTTTKRTTIGSQVRSLRDDGLKLSQDTLGKRAGVCAEYISMIETGERMPSIALLMRLAKVFKVQASSMLAAVERQKR